MLFFLFLLPNFNTAYELSCPTSSHWKSRAEGLCTIRLAFQYYCLWDTNNKSYTESCSDKPDVAPKGRKYIVEGSPTFVPCALDRYQPIIYYRNASSHCMLLKSLCAGKGQAFSGHGSTEDDVRCRCDYKQGYHYVISPKDMCHCNPTQEDCSCYLKQCKNNEYLSRDYQCLLRDSFPFKFRCGQINESREENNTTVLSKDILTDSAMKTNTNGQTVGIVLIVIIALFIGFSRMIYHMLTVCLRDPIIQNGIPLERQIIGNWRALKETINPDIMLRSLVKEGMIQTDRKHDFKLKSRNSQKNHYLICLIRKSRDPRSVNKCIGILRMQGNSTIKVLKRSVINQIWRKRNLEKCRQQLAKCTPSLHEFFNPDKVVDHFLEHFIFDVKDFEDVLNCEDSRTMTQCFIEKVEKSLHKGSFECLLKVLKDYKYNIAFQELKTGLVPAISCDCGDGIIYSQFLENNYEVHMTLSSTNLNEDIEFELWDSSCDCLLWLVKTFGVYPITSFINGSATFHPLSYTTVEHLKEGSRCGNWSHFIETVFSSDYIKNSEENRNVSIKMNISVTTDGERDQLLGQHLNEDDSVNIITANRKFLESHMDVNELIIAFLKQGQTIFQECERIPEIDQKAQMFVGLLEQNIHLKSQLIRILIKQKGKNKKILDRLHTSQKVFKSNAVDLADNIMHYFTDLVCLADDFEDFRNEFIDRNILSAELESIQQERHKNNRHKMIAFLIKILKSRRKNTMLSLVDSLFMYEHNILAERLLQRKKHRIEVSDSKITTESLCSNNDGLLFSGNFKVCYIE